MKTLLLLFGLVPLLSHVFADKKVVCYYGSWAVYRPEPGKFPVEEIDPFICTHLIFGFAGLSGSNTIKALDAWQELEDDWGKGAYKRFNNLKTKNTALKTILAIGGWNEGSTKYSTMARNPASRKTFVDSVVAFLERHKFDGLDMDWEYPANRGGEPEDKQNFVLLLKELHEAFAPKGFLLTAAVSAGKGTIDTAYDVPQVSKYLDFINLMAYDYHGGWEKHTGHNSPLYARPDESVDDQILNVNYSVNYWIQQGAPPEKIILGMGLYGRGFTLQKSEENGLYAPAPSPSQAGPYTREPGMMGYNEICEKQSREKWNVVWDDYYQSPYMFKERQWIGYDDQKSIRLKSEYAMRQGLGGGMVWSIETDDFHGKCHGHRYPLLKVINDVFRQGVVGPEPTLPTPGPEGPKTTSGGGVITQRPVTQNPVTRPPVRPDEQCQAEGWFRDPKDCARYWWCYVSGNHYERQEFRCDGETVFDFATNTCNWPGSVSDC